MCCFLGAFADGAFAAQPFQSFEVEVPNAPVPVRSEGRQRLVYELHLTNFADATLVLKRVRVQDAASGRSLATFDGDALAGRLKIVDAQQASASARAAIEPGQRGIVFVELDLAPDETVHALAHAIDFEARDGVVHTSTPASVAVHAMRVPVLGAPLHGGPWIAVHDPRWPRGHRRMIYAIDGKARLPGRFAVDWAGVDMNGRTTQGDPDRPAEAIGYGTDVLAGAEAIVASVRDGMDESTSIKNNPSHPLGGGAGNYVALRIAPDLYVFYEHLRRGSVAVRAGERVRKGQVIGALGFSGDSTGPHLHLHVADCGDPLRCEGVPYDIEGMIALGRYDDPAAIGSKPWRAEQEKSIAPEWPGSNVVVRFR
jgi:peptidase M23-like protein